MALLIIIISCILLGMILSPILLGIVKRGVNWMYWNLNVKTDKDDVGIPSNMAPVVNEKPSFVGKSKFKVGHSRTNTATIPENEKVIEKEDTFADESQDDPGLMDEVNVPLEKKEEPPPEEIDADDEAEGLEHTPDAVLASGSSYDELMKTGRILNSNAPTVSEKEEAGRILYENQSTQLFQQMMESGPALSRAITSAIDSHLAKFAEDNPTPDETVYPDDFKDFDINSIF